MHCVLYVISVQFNICTSFHLCTVNSRFCLFTRNCRLISIESTLVSVPLLARGGGLVFQAGYHSRKRTFKTHPMHVFSRYENRPYLHAFAWFLLIFSIMPFPKFVNMTKKVFNFTRFCTPSRYTHVHCLVLKNNPNYVIFLRGWYPTSNTSGPPGCQKKKKRYQAHFLKFFLTYFLARLLPYFDSLDSRLSIMYFFYKILSECIRNKLNIILIHITKCTSHLIPWSMNKSTIIGLNIPGLNHWPWKEKVYALTLSLSLVCRPRPY